MRFRAVSSTTLLAGLAMLAGCVDGGVPSIGDGQGLGFETIGRGTSSGYDASGFKGLDLWSTSQWRAFWNQHASDQVPPPAAPAIDFENRTVLAVFLGQKPTGGYSIQIESVVVEGARLMVSYSTAAPERGCGTTQALTQPHHIVWVPRPDGVDKAAFRNVGDHVRDC